MSHIRVEQDEELAQVIFELWESEDDLVVFEFPPGARVAKNGMNLKLLAEEARRLGKEIQVFSRDPDVQELARRADLDVREPEEAPRPLRLERRSALSSLGPQRKVTDIFAPPPPRKKSEVVKEEEEDREELEEREVEERPPMIFPEIRPRRRVSKMPVFLVGGVLLLIAGVAIFGSGVFASASVTVTVRRDEIPFEVELTVDAKTPTLNVEKSILPGEILSLEKEFRTEITASGKKQVSERARGTILVSNAFSSSPQTLVENTRFLSKEGKLFRLVKTTVIPGAGVEEGRIIPKSIAADVVADQPGSSFNIGSSEFTIPGFQGTPKYTGFFAKSEAAMTGGAEGELPVVEAKDLEGVGKAAREALEPAMRSEFEKKIPSGLRVLEDARVITFEESHPAVGAAVEKGAFSFVVKGTVRAVAFRNAHAEELVRRFLESKKKLPTESDGTIEASWSVRTKDIEAGRLSIVGRGKGVFRAKVVTQDLSRSLAGKSEPEIRELLATNPAIERAEVTLWPFWIRTAPKNPNRISVNVD